MLISQLAARTGHSIDTISFYQKLGLLDGRHFARAANNYREYTEEAVDRLTLIRNAQAAGITLAEVGRSIDAWESDTIDRSEKVAFFNRRIADINARILALQRVKAYLESKLVANGSPPTVSEGL